MYRGYKTAHLHWADNLPTAEHKLLYIDKILKPINQQKQYIVKP